MKWIWSVIGLLSCTRSKVKVGAEELLQNPNLCSMDLVRCPPIAMAGYEASLMAYEDCLSECRSDEKKIVVLQCEQICNKESFLEAINAVPSSYDTQTTE